MCPVAFSFDCGLSNYYLRNSPSDGIHVRLLVV